MNASDLAHFSGTSNYYAHPLNRSLVYTDGVQCLAEGAGAYWLIDLIASHQPSLKPHRFQLWGLSHDGNGGCVVTCQDGDYKTLLSQAVEFTDFPASLGDPFRLYVEETSLDGVNPCRVLMLPSER